jgi:hypothetical protein
MNNRMPCIFWVLLLRTLFVEEAAGLASVGQIHHAAESDARPFANRKKYSALVSNADAQAFNMTSLFELDALDHAEIVRPKLSAGCASAEFNWVVGFAALFLIGVWTVALRWLLRQPAKSCDDGQRMPALDAAKFVLMIPVINEHASFWFGPLVLRGAMQYVHFHTRTFCFISGLTAQSPVSEKGVRSVVFRLIAPTILWQTWLRVF